VTGTLSRKTASNATILTLGAAVESVLQFGFLVIVGRELGPAEFGFYGYILSLVTFAITAAHFGLPAIAVREMAQRPTEESPIFAATFRIRAALSVVFVVTSWIVAAATPLADSHRAAVIFMFAYLLCVPFDLAPLFDARKLSRWDVPGKLAGRIASLGLLGLIWWQRGAITVSDVALCSSFLIAVNVAVGWVVAKRLGLSLHPLAETCETVKLVRLSIPVLWSNLMMITYSQSLTILVKAFSTALETGYYALANRLLMPILIVKGILYRLLLPIVSEVGLDGTALTARLERILLALALIFMPAVAFGIPAAAVIIVPLFGQQFAGAVLPFQVSISLLIFTGMGSMFGTALLGAGDARTPTVGLTVGTILSVVLCLLLIPTYGATGAAWAAWLGELVAVVYTIPNFLRLTRPRILGRLLRIAAASLCGPIAFYALTAVAIVDPVFALAVTALVILAALAVIGEISPRKLKALFALIKWPSTS
jgi:polysaccharide transporter, PST family